MKPNHERLLMRYLVAFDEGDFATISDICELALQDQELTKSIIEINLELGEEELNVVSTNVNLSGTEVTREYSRSTPNQITTIMQLPMVRWVAAAMLIVILGGMLIFITRPTNPTGSSPSATPDASPTPSVTPFQNPFEPVNGYETTKPVLDNGRGSIRLKYPDNFTVRQNDLGVFVETNVFENLKIIVHTGQSMLITSDVPAGSSYADYQADLLAHLRQNNNDSLEGISSAEYTINGQRVIEYTHRSSTYMLIEHPSGDPIIIEVYQPNKTTATLVYDIALAIASSIEYDASAYTTASYTEIVAQTVQVNFNDTSRHQISFEADQYGMSYPFTAEAGTQKLITVNFGEEGDSFNYAIQPSVFLLDADGIPIDYIEGPTTADTLSAYLAIPADGDYTLLIMPRTNGIREGANTGTQYFVEIINIRDMNVDSLTTGTVTTEQPTTAYRRDVDVYDEWTIEEIRRSHSNSYVEVQYVVPLDMNQALAEVTLPRLGTVSKTASVQSSQTEDLIDFKQSGWVLVVISANDTLLASGETFEIEFEINVFE